ncbi:exonuclease domain-containing protein [Nocardiopsis terrae]|uniref:exonuclease domain-containing protein n=1 Tax=Streptomyces sp. NPDC057554 TaxID=3350538 RepID=UPI003675C4EC
MIPMQGLDLETTGIDVEQARILDWAIANVGGDQPAEFTQALVNPGVPIPAESTEIHGITDEHVADAVSPDVAVTRIVQHLSDALGEGRPIVGHNISYDLTVLDRECRRHLGEPLETLLGVPVRPVIDTLVLSKHLDPYRKRVSETQGAHQLRTCVEKLVTPRWSSVVWSEEDAHGALYDCRMALYVAAAVLGHPRLRRFGLGELHDAQVVWRGEQCASFQEYKQRTDPSVRIDGRWPVVPFEPRQESLIP